MMPPRALLPALGAFLLLATPVFAQQQGQRPRPQDTEVWEPVPAVITPGAYAMAAPPSDAIVLFDGANLNEWVNARNGEPAGWSVENGVFTVVKSVGDIRTRREFGSYQLHIEWRIPEQISGEGQNRGNSGLFMAWQGGSRGYELQILDSYQNSTYVNGMAGAIYKQSIPLVNAARKPGEWQTYDVIWNAPTFTADGALATPARMTVYYNGVLVQNDFELPGVTLNVGTPSYRAHGNAPIMLQAHGDPSPPISFRNIWLREIR